MPPSQTPAANDEYVVRQWRTDDGLPQSTVTAIVQTPDGYLWLGTFQGLVRFDGQKFVVFQTQNTPELPSSRIVSLYLDRRGALWITSEYGDLTRLQDGRFTSFPLRGDACAFDSSGTDLGEGVRVKGEDAEGRLWVQAMWSTICYRQAGARFERQRGVRVVDSGLALPAPLSGDDIKFWDGRGASLAWLHVAGAPTNAAPLLTSSEGVIWARTTRGLAKWRRGAWERVVPLDLPNNDAGAMWEDRRGVLWITPNQAPLYRVDPGGGVRVFKLDVTSRHESIRAICEDREGNLWIGLEGAGLFRLKPRTFNSYGFNEGLVSRLAKSVAVDAEDRVWVMTGAQAGFLSRGRPPFINPPDLAMGVGAWCSLTDEAGALWLGSYGGGLFRWQAGQLTPFPMADRGQNWVMKALHRDRAGVLWAGGQHHVARLEGNALRNVRVPLSTNQAELDVCAIADDSRGRHYFGLNRGGGLYELSPAGDWRRYTVADGLPSNTLRSLLVDQDDALWIGPVEGGLCRFKQGKFSRFPVLAGQFPGPVLGILQDDQDRFWLSSSHGIYLASRQELNEFAEGRRASVSTIQYTTADGLGAFECAGGLQPTSARARDGRLWFATIDGVAVVNPRTMPRNPLPPPVVIEDVWMDGRLLSPAPISNLKVTARGPVAVPPGSRRLEIRYTALSFTAPEKVRFRYRLDGLDHDWNEAGGRREAYFQGLGPGDYRFRVMACNNDAVWNDTGATLALVVQPFYWQTTWFRFTTALLLAAFLAGVVRSLVLRKARQRIERLERQLAVDRERERIASDLHDDLGSSLTRISLLGEITESQLHEPAQARDSVRRMTETSRDVVRAMDEILWALNPKNDTLENLVTFISQFAREHLSLAGIQCRLDLPMSMPPRVLDSQFRHNLLLTVKEGLNNVVKHAGATEVQIAVALEGNLLRLIISDNGRGFVTGAVPADGDGLVNLPRRVQSLGGECLIASEPGQGTRVRIALPLPRATDY